MRKLSLPSESFKPAISQLLESYWNMSWLRSGKKKTTITKKKRKHKESIEVISITITKKKRKHKECNEVIPITITKKKKKTQRKY